MKIKWVVLVLFWSIIWPSLSVMAANQYSLQQLVEKALAYRPLVAISYYETERVKSDLQTAKGALYPSLDYITSISNVDKEDTKKERNIENKISLGYRVTDFGLRTASIDRAKYTKESSDIDYLKTKTLVAKEVSQIYLNIRQYDEMLDAIEEEKLFYKKMLDNLSRLVSSGVAMQSDIRRIQVSIDALNVREIQYKSLLDTELFKLKNMTGMEITSKEITQSQLPFVAYYFIDSQESIMEGIKVSNYDYKILLSAKKAAIEEMKIAKASYYPAVDMSADYVDNHPSGNADKEDFEDEMRVSLNITVNLFSGFRHSAETLKTAANYQQAELKLTDFILQTRYEADALISRYHAVDQSYMVAKRSRENALKLTSLYEQEFQLGSKSLLDLISIRNESFQALVSIVDSQYGLYNVKLEQLTLLSNLSHYLGVTSSLPPLL